MIDKINSLNELNEKLNRRHVMLFGAGYASRTLLKYVSNFGYFIEKVCVSNPDVNPEYIFGTTVCSFSSLNERETVRTCLIVAITEKYQGDVFEYLRNNKFKEIYCITDSLLEQITQINMDGHIASGDILHSYKAIAADELGRMIKFIKKPCLEYMIVNILDHCNLRCKGCDHFACIADEKFYHREDIYKDLSRMSEIFHSDYIMKIAVMGGEPLLHPELKQILADVRECFPHTIIRLTTNGLLLLQQDDDFWKICRENDVTVVNTKYPLNLKYDEIQKKASEEGVKFQFFEGTGDGKIKHSFKKIINLKGDSNPAESFSRCHISNYGNILLDGKFYGCPFSIQSYRIFNKKFSQNLRMTEDDYIDIYKVDDKEEFFKFAARPKYYCRYCCGLSPEFPWERSKQKMSEWVETEI